MTPAARPAISRSHVLAWARDYAQRFRGTMRLLTAHRPRICPFERLATIVPQRSSVLDIGCGNGLFLYLLFRAGRLAEGQGVDVRTEATSAGNAALQAEGASRITLTVAGRAQWPDRRFDVVAMIDVMHHVAIDERLGMLASAFDRVAPGGLLVYKDMAATPSWAAWMNRLHDLALARQWVHYLPSQVVEEAATRRGFTIEQADAFRLGWYAHELRVFRRDGADTDKSR